MWEAEMKRHFPNRETKAFAIDLSGKFVLITRFLTPIKPPDSLIQNLVNADEVMFRLARFVSLVPSTPDTVAIPGVSDIWCSCNQFLDMISGDEEEHAILLCNFFLYLNKKVGIILGSGIPEGPTCYVIVWDYNSQEPSIWNPISGERFSVRDSYLPLNSIGTIFTVDNVS
jgi:coiled-coil and C2 domain-containing protein 2A